MPHLQANGLVDLTGAKVFLTEEELQKRFAALVHQHAGDRTIVCQNRKVVVGMAVSLLLADLANMYKLWNSKTMLGPSDLSAYSVAIGRFRDLWKALEWKPTPWLHWVCAHSEYFLRTYRSWYAFSSIPTEHRHQGFKRDLKNTNQSFKYKAPELSTGYLRRCVELDALDLGLRTLNFLAPPAQEEVFTPTHLGKRRRV
jgi:hypothetical protein